jgi:hypothetical protein
LAGATTAVVLFLQPIDDSVPARGIGEGAMDEDDSNHRYPPGLLIRVRVRAIASRALIGPG